MNTDLIILRQTDYAALVNNGAPLTNDEQDGNLVNIYKDFEALAVTTSVEAYSASTTYNDYDNQFATYGGRLWQWINSTPGSGQTPVDGVYWIEVFPTILAHRRNSDTILDEGGANEISAAAIVAGLAAADATTDLGISTHTGYTFLLTSSTGADVTIPEATEELSGLLNKDDKAVLNMTSGQNTGDQTLGSLGAEAEANKATDFSTLNDQLYPSVQAVETRITAETSSIVGAATTEGDTLEKLEDRISTGVGKIWKAQVTQAGTNAPVLTVLVNTLGVTAVGAYVSPGLYEINGFAGNLTGLVEIECKGRIFGANKGWIYVVDATTSQLNVQTFNSGFSPANDVCDPLYQRINVITVTKYD